MAQRSIVSVSNYEAKIQERKEAQGMTPASGATFLLNLIANLERRGWEAEKPSRAFSKLK